MNLAPETLATLSPRELTEPLVVRRPAVAQTPSLTVVCCVESGPLETSTVWMIESLRRWGGRFAQVPVIAVTPRLGPPLMSSTLRRFDDLAVRYLRRRAKHTYHWYTFLNKPAALLMADEMVDTDLVCWLDGDVLVVGEPEALDLGDSADFAACPSDCNIGSTGADHRFDRWWQEMCAVFGLKVDDLPWVTTYLEGRRIRFYFNAGVMVYRRSTGYVRAYYNGCMEVLRRRISSAESRLWFSEQATVGLVAIHQGLRCRILPGDHNFPIGSKLAEPKQPNVFAQARVLHYHDAMWPHFYPRFVEMCRVDKPHVYEWLREVGPVSNRASITARVVQKLLTSRRSRQEMAFEASCQKF